MAFIDEKFFKDDGENIVFTGEAMECYIPLIYQEKNMCEEIGEHFKVLGVFLFRTFNKDDKTKPNPMRTLNLPIMISTHPSEYETKTMDLLKNGEEDTYLVLTYYTGDILCRNAEPQSTPIVISFLKLLRSGKLPKSIKYCDVLPIWMKNMSMNGVKFSVPMQVYEMIIYKIYRNKKKLEEPFGKYLGRNPKGSMLDYATLNERQITSYSSTFAGIMFEDMDNQIINAVNSSTEGRKEVESPMEEVMKY